MKYVYMHAIYYFLYSNWGFICLSVKIVFHSCPYSTICLRYVKKSSFHSFWLLYIFNPLLQNECMKIFVEYANKFYMFVLFVRIMIRMQFNVQIQKKFFSIYLSAYIVWEIFTSSHVYLWNWMNYQWLQYHKHTTTISRLPTIRNNF